MDAALALEGMGPCLNAVSLCSSQMMSVCLAKKVPGYTTVGIYLSPLNLLRMVIFTLLNKRKMVVSFPACYSN